MGGAYSMHGSDNKLNLYNQSKNLNGRVYLEDLGIDGRVILKCILKKQDVIMCDDAEWRWATGFCGHKLKFQFCKRLEMLTI